MMILDDTNFLDRVKDVEILRRLGPRPISRTFHDVDGMHSLLRELPPGMSALVSSGIAVAFRTTTPEMVMPPTSLRRSSLCALQKWMY